MKKFLAGLAFGLLTFGGINSFVCSNYLQIIEDQEKEIFALENEKRSMEYTIRDLKAENDFLSKWTFAGEWKITFYWPGEDEWGSMTSTGVTAKEGVTVAVDPELIPYGSEVFIFDHIYKVQDTGSALKGKKVIDIYVEKPRYERYFTDVYIRTQK